MEAKKSIGGHVRGGMDEHLADPAELAKRKTAAAEATTERVGRASERAAERVGRASERAAERVGRASERAAEATVGRASERAAEATKNIGGSVRSKFQ